MNKKTFLIVLPLLVLSIGVLAGCIRGVTGDSLVPVGEQDLNSDTHLPDALHTIAGDHVSVDPRVVEDLEKEEWVSVHIAIRFAPEFQIFSGPHDEAYEEAVRTLDWELYKQSMAKREADVQAALGSDNQWPGYHINASGLDTLRKHPYVLLVAWTGGSTFDYSPVD